MSTTATTISATAFASDEGINADLAFGAWQGGQITGYTNVSLDLAELQTLGISRVRTFLTNAGAALPNGAPPAGYDSATSSSLSSYEQLAAAGIKFDFIIANGPMTAAQVQGYIDLISQIQAADPGSVIGIEGVNESTYNSAITYTAANGQVTTGDAAALAMQQAIYADVAAASNLADVTVVDNTTDSPFGSALNPNPATTPGIADVANFHEYADQGYPGAAGAVIPYIAEAPNAVDQPVAGAGATWVTEWGYPLSPGNSAGVSELVAGAYELDTIMDYATSNTPNFLYGLNEDTNYFGEYYSNGALTTEGQDIANLNAIVAATNAGAMAATPTIDATADLSALTDGRMLQVGRDLVIWAEPGLVNQITGASLYPMPSPIDVTVQLGGTFAVQEFDPTLGTAAIASFASVTSVTIGVAASPIFLQLTPASAAGTGGGGGAVVQQCTITGQPGSFIVTDAGASTFVQLGAGTEQVQALGTDTISAGTGTSTVYANTDANPVDVTGGAAGSSGTFIMASGTVTEGAGTDQTVTYTGGLTFIGGSGSETLSLNAGRNSVTPGSGSLTVFEAGGTATTYTFTAAAAGGSVTIYGLGSSDTINLASDDVTDLAALQAATTCAGGNAIVDLGGGTTVTLVGISDVGSLAVDYATAAGGSDGGGAGTTPGGTSGGGGGTSTGTPTVIQGTPGANIVSQTGGYTDVELGGGNETATLMGHDHLTSGPGNATVYANNDADAAVIAGGGAGSTGTYIVGSNATADLLGGTDLVSSYGTDNTFVAGDDAESTDSFYFGGGGNSFTGGSGGATATVYANDTGDNDFVFEAGQVAATTIYGIAASDTVDVSQYVTSAAGLAAAASENYAGLALAFVNPIGGDTRILLAGVTDLASVHFNY